MEELVRLCLEKHINISIVLLSVDEVRVTMSNPFTNKTMHFDVALSMLDDPLVLEDLKNTPAKIMDALYSKKEEQQ